MRLWPWAQTTEQREAVRSWHNAAEAAGAYVTEALNRARQELSEEDLGWTRLDGMALARDVDAATLAEMRARCLKLWLIDPLAAQVVNLTGCGAFGAGVQAPHAQDKNVRAVVEHFWEDADNQLAFFSRVAMVYRNIMLFIMGEQFLTVHSSAADPWLKLADLPATEITEVITHPDNRLRPVLYKREYYPAEYDFSTGRYQPSTEKRVRYYLDWRYAPDHLDSRATADPQVQRLVRAAGNALVADTHLYHLRVNTVGKRGVPELYRMYDWAKAHARALSDLTTLSKALAMLAWKQTVQTNSSEVLQQFAEQMRRRQGGNSEAGPPGPGGVRTQNAKTDIEPVSVGTGGVQNLGNAARATKLQAIAAFGFGEHWFSDASTGNLATASAMELPALQRLEDRQALFAQVIDDLCGLQVARVQNWGRAARTRGGDMVRVPRDAEVRLDVNMPPVQPRSPEAASTMLQALGGASGTLVLAQEASRAAYEALGSNNIEALLEEQYPGGAEQEQEPPQEDTERAQTAQDDEEPLVPEALAEARAAEAMRPFVVSPQAAQIERAWAAALTSRVIEPWRQDVKAWLRALDETAPQEAHLDAMLRLRVPPNTVALAEVMREFLLRAGNAAGQHAIDRMRALLRRRQEATVREAEGDARTTLAERLRNGQEWNQGAGAFVFNLRDPLLLRELQQRGTKITGEVTDTMLGDLRGVLEREIYRAGQNPRQIADALDDIFPATYANRGLNIARTEMVIAQGMVGHAAYERNGVGSHQWFAFLDGATRPDHAAAHGQVRAIGEPFLVGDARMKHPGDPDAPVEQVARCRCDELPVIDDTTALPAQPWLGGYQPLTDAARQSAAPLVP